MSEVVLLLGGNLGDVEQTLLSAVQDLQREVGEVCAASEVMLSDAWGFDAAPFLNQAVIIKTELSPLELLAATQRIEQRLGRDRVAEAETKRKSAASYLDRKIDIDIIFYAGQVVEEEHLQIPHLLITKREFALRPIAQIAPQWLHPQNGKSVEEMLRDLKS